MDKRKPIFIAASYTLVPLTRRGEFVEYTIVDWYDSWVTTMHWMLSPGGYAYRSGEGRAGHTLLLHRVLLGLKPGDGKVTDHINRDKLDNRRSNLRVGTHQDNAMNRGPSSPVPERMHVLGRSA